MPRLQSVRTHRPDARRAPKGARLRAILPWAACAWLLASAPSARGADPPGSVAVISWEAPGDDGTIGTATRYELRFRPFLISAPDTLAWWNAATIVPGVPAPGAPGATDSVVVSGLDPSTAYYFMLRVGDEVPNWSAFSNLVEKPAFPDVTSPAAIRDLDVVPGTAMTTAPSDSTRLLEPRAAPPR